MPSATKLEKAATFTATSPITGRTYTRKSQHLYTHACISYQEPEAQAKRLERDAQAYVESAERAHDVANHLRAGRTPAAGSWLLEREPSPSGQMQQAGVRTRWDAVLFYQERLSIYVGKTADERADSYVEDAQRDLSRAAECRVLAAKILADRTVREGATFHHSSKLAEKEAQKQVGYPGEWKTRIVEAVMG